MKREIKVRVDLNVKSYDEVMLKQLDSTQLQFEVYQANTRVVLENLTASIIFLKPNGKIVIQSAIIDSVNNIVKVNLKADCVRNYGRGKIEVELKKDDEVVSSFQLDVKIEKTAKDYTPSENEPNYIERVEEALRDLENKVQNGDFNGESAYEIAVKHGFVGTEAEWIASFEGKQDEITTENKLSSDLVDDTEKNHKFITAQERENWNNKVNKEDGKELISREANSWLTNFIDEYDSAMLEKDIEDHYAMTPDPRVYVVRFPKFDTSNTATGEKLGANVGKYVKLATDTEYEETNYGEAFETLDCNAYVDENGVRHIKALKGMASFRDTGKVDVFTLHRTYYEKTWEDTQYDYYARTYMPMKGFTPVILAINKDGTVNPWFTIAKYMAGTIVDDDGVRKPYSSKGLVPARVIGNPTGACAGENDNISYAGSISFFNRRGTYYTAGLAAELAHIEKTIWLKWATRSSQSVVAGCTDNSRQYVVSSAEANVSRVILTTAQANLFDLNTFVSVGDKGSNSSTDRYYGYMHNLAYNVEIIGKEIIDENHTALILDCDAFTITDASTTYVSTMHERSGYSDFVLGRNGSRISNTNGRHGAVIDGIECFVGGWEVLGNAIMDIIDENGSREVYVTNDATKLTTDIAKIKSTYKKSEYKITATSKGVWLYITEMKIDLELGIVIPTKAGQSGSGSNTGYGDGEYLDAATSGQREFLGLRWLELWPYCRSVCSAW